MYCIYLISVFSLSQFVHTAVPGLFTMNVTCTLVRKSVTSIMRKKFPALRDDIAKLMYHRPGTADRFYLIEDRIKERSGTAALVSSLVDVSEQLINSIKEI